MAIDFDTIYGADLVYRPDCWQLCGDAHCCNFSRYKARFRILERHPDREVLMLPGEYDYLRSRGWLEQFGNHQHNVIHYAFGERSVNIEWVTSPRPGCACDHPTRSTFCRLYPLLPVFDVEGRLTGTEDFGMYEVLEDLEGLDRACRITELPFDQVDKLLAIASAISSDPKALFYVSAYRLAKNHLRQRLQELHGDAKTSYFQVFETNLLMRRLMDHQRLCKVLSELATAFEDRYGERFSLP